MSASVQESLLQPLSIRLKLGTDRQQHQRRRRRQVHQRLVDRSTRSQEQVHRDDGADASGLLLDQAEAGQ